MKNLKEFESWCEKKGALLLSLFVLAYVLVFSALSFLKYYSFSYYDWDFASDIVVLWNSIHGRFLYYPFLEQNIFGAHLYLILLGVLPVYALLQHPLTLLFLQSLFLGLVAYPLYFFARPKIGALAALAVSLVYLLYPSVGFVNLFETHFEIYEVFFLSLAFYFFDKEDFRRFLIFAGLTLACKENASFVVFMLGLYALARRRPLRWVLVPMAAGVLWFLAAVKWIIPSLARDSASYQQGFIFSIYYKHLGSSLGEMLKSIFFHPVVALRFALQPHKIVYLFQVFSPVGFICFFSPASLLVALPVFMQNLLSSAPTHAQIYYQYMCLLIPPIFVSLILGLKKLFSYVEVHKFRYLIICFLLVSCVGSGFFYHAPQFFLPRYLRALRLDEAAEVKAQLVRLVPKKAPVIATFAFLPHLADRSDLSSMHLVSMGYRMYTQMRYVPPANLQYALVDFNDALMLGSFFPAQAPAHIKSFLNEGEWRVIAGAGDIILFKKGDPDGFGFLKVLKDVKPDIGAHVNFGNQIEFLGYNIINVRTLGSVRIFHLETYWRRLSENVDPLGLTIVFLDPRSARGFGLIHLFGYRVYPPQDWPKDAIVEEHVFVPVPYGVSQGLYRIEMALLSFSKGRNLPAIFSDRTEKSGRIIVGDALL